MSEQQNPLSRVRLSNPTHLLALGFGSGLMPKAPGTWGSALAIILGAPLLHWMGAQFFFLFILASFSLGCYLCHKTAEDMQVHDHGAIVWDEFVGIFITLLALPALSWSWLLLAFCLFRFFDILKPAPIKYFDQKLQTGFGIMIDDVLAGFYAFGVIAVMRYIF